jgi:hypothetical protein
VTSLLRGTGGGVLALSAFDPSGFTPLRVLPPRQ